LTTSRQTPSYARLFDDLRVALTVHRCGSMTRAAVELDTTTSTVSRQIRIGAMPSVIVEVLIPALGALRSAVPGLRPVFENRIQEVGLGMCDVALVFALPEGGRIKTRRCGSIAFGLYAPPDWRHGDGWVTLTDRYAARYSEARRAWFGTDPALKVDSFAQAVAAMHTLDLAGILPVVVGASEPDFVHIPGSGLDLTRDLHMIYHESRSRDADLRSVIDWICRQTERLPAMPDHATPAPQTRIVSVNS
jgi:DNA-binding transcriptional LysR family regulator